MASMYKYIVLKNGKPVFRTNTKARADEAAVLLKRKHPTAKIQLAERQNPAGGRGTSTTSTRSNAALAGAKILAVATNAAGKATALTVQLRPGVRAADVGKVAGAKVRTNPARVRPNQSSIFISATRVKIDRQGYEKGGYYDGKYWGVGAPLYRWQYDNETTGESDSGERRDSGGAASVRAWVRKQFGQKVSR